MSASIRIESGIAAGTNYWIDRPVLRIGSDPQCEICLPTADLAPHAITLEFRGGAYKAYNRGTAPVYIGSATLQPGGAANWDDGMAATLPGDLRLVLEFDGDPRPCPRPEARMNDGFDDRPAISSEAAAAAPEAAQKAKSKSMMQIAVIVGCVLATGGFLLLNNIGGGSSAAPAPNRPTFNSIVLSSQDKSERIRTYVQKLQVGRSYIVRGHADIGRAVYAELRDQLVRQIKSLPEADRDQAEKIRQYVEQQLALMQG
jgi:hypothetical protein